MLGVAGSSPVARSTICSYDSFRKSAGQPDRSKTTRGQPTAMALFSKDIQPPTPPRADPQSPGPRGSVVGPNLAFDGTLTGNEPLTVEGAVRGKINLESDLRVGPRARVEATVHAKNVLIEGVVIGD